MSLTSLDLGHNSFTQESGRVFTCRLILDFLLFLQVLMVALPQNLRLRDFNIGGSKGIWRKYSIKPRHRAVFDDIISRNVTYHLFTLPESICFANNVYPATKNRKPK